MLRPAYPPTELPRPVPDPRKTNVRPAFLSPVRLATAAPEVAIVETCPTFAQATVVLARLATGGLPHDDLSIVGNGLRVEETTGPMHPAESFAEGAGFGGAIGLLIGAAAAFANSLPTATSALVGLGSGAAIGAVAAVFAEEVVRRRYRTKSVTELALTTYCVTVPIGLAAKAARVLTSVV